MDENLNLLEAEYGNSSKSFSNLSGLNLLGTPGYYSGFDRKNNLSWSKQGVAVGYMVVPILKTCIDLISENLGSVPQVLKDNRGNTIKRSDTSGSQEEGFLSVIERSYKYYKEPLITMWGRSLLLYGETYIQKIYSTYGDARNLKWLNPLAVTIDTSYRNNRNSLGYEERKYQYSNKYGSLTLKDDEVLMSRKHNPIDDVRGYSDALSALGKANITMEFDTFTIAFYDNAGHPGVIVSPRDRLVSEKHVADWQQQWNNKFRGSQSQFKTHISSFPFDVQTFPVLDVSKPLEVSQNAENTIKKVFRVSDALLGGSQESGHQFSKETKNAFIQTVVRPLGLIIANSINHSGVIKEFGLPDEFDLKFGFDFSEFETVAKTDMDRQTVEQNKFQTGAISLGAYQRGMGAEVSPGADDLYMIPQGFQIIKKDEFLTPENINPMPDQPGPDENPLNQSPRQTQSMTEEQESTEFYGSKSYDVSSESNENDLNLRFSTSLGTGTLNYDEISFLKAFPSKYDHINFNPPKGVQEEAKRALDWIEEGLAGDGFTDVGRKRAVDLSKSDYQPSPEVVKRMYSYLSRATGDSGPLEKDGKPTPKRVAIAAWGGEPALSWSEKIVNQMDKADKKEAKKSITIDDLEKVSNQYGISLVEAIKYFEEFDDEF